MFMNLRVVSLIVLAIAILCLPIHSSAKMTALTAVEMDRISAQKGIATLAGALAVPQLPVSSEIFGPQAGAIIFGDVANGRDVTSPYVSPMFTVPISMDRHFTGTKADSIALQGYALAACTAGLVNPLFGGLFGLGLVPGAFDVTVGDISVQMTGNIDLIFHP